MVLKQSGAEPKLVHCHVTVTVETFVTRAVTSEGVGGAEGVMMQKRKKVALSQTITKKQSFRYRKDWVI